MQKEENRLSTDIAMRFYPCRMEQARGVEVIVREGAAGMPVLREDS
jgi:hypothetical protein